MFSNYTPADLQRAASLLAGGGLMAFPTETVYGLGADTGCAPRASGTLVDHYAPRTTVYLVPPAGMERVADCLVATPEQDNRNV